ncbi:uncharacterized protein C8Q71DRAFT_786570 [Rhodofomes roseus]|uniref:Uncharacterized protein n=1 Tax=Rhodofomes roseus TaxID=34475 RepID=A0ABQ8K230_9APHY|nr:uncharacterized protein C8Q71DRAFT_786570 [Rhodofomes roseus]KAH9830280.1 hypothetical protein C8Q71DRAFT_786570 [Rhodofomes roseus]
MHSCAIANSLMLLLTVTAFLLSYFTVRKLACVKKQDVLYFDTFSQSFQMVLLARLLLNLREGALKHVIMDEENSGFSHFLDDLTHVSSIEFNPDPTDNTPRLGLHQPTTEDETGDEPSDVDEVADGHGIEAHELREISVARV